MQSQVVAQPSFENVSVWGDHKLDLKQDPVKIFNSFWFLYFLEKKNFNLPCCQPLCNVLWLSFLYERQN